MGPPEPAYCTDALAFGDVEGHERARGETVATAAVECHGWRRVSDQQECIESN